MGGMPTCLIYKQVNIGKCEKLQSAVAIVPNRFLPKAFQKMGDTLMIIAPTFYQGLDCIDLLVVSYAKHMGKDIDCIFSRSWAFGFSANTLKLTSEQYASLGFNIAYYNIIDCNLFIEYAKEMFHQSLPVGIYIDSFYCPWHSRFQLDHGHHYVLAFALKGDTLVCIDPGFNQTGVEYLPVCFLEKGYNNFFLLSPAEPTTTKYSEDYATAIRLLKEANVPNEIRKFADYIRSDFDYTHMCLNIRVNPWACDIFRDLLFIAGGRRQFAKYLSFMQPYVLSYDFTNIIKKINFICSKWDAIRWILVKCGEDAFVSRYKELICEMLQEISNEEEDSIDALFHGSMGESCEAPAIVHLPYEKVLYQIDLQTYFNNKAFSFDNNEPADYTGLMEWYYFDSNDDVQLQKLKKDYNIRVCIGSVADNITCEKQKIIFPMGYYNTIVIIASSGFEDYASKLQLLSAEGDKIDIDFICENWVSCKPDSTIASFSRAHKHGDGVISFYENKGHLYKYKLYLPKGIMSKGVILPLCPNIHIFSMTLTGEGVGME